MSHLHIHTVHFISTYVWLDSQKQYMRKLRLCLQHASGIHSPTISAELTHFHSSDTAPASPERAVRLIYVSFGLAAQFSEIVISGRTTICEAVTHNDCGGERSFGSSVLFLWPMQSVLPELH